MLDWEMATLGDPLTDVGLLCLPAARRASTDCVAVSDVARRARLHHRPPSCVERYAAAQRPRPRPPAGSTSALAYFKLAVILEGIHYRYTQGQTVGERLRPASARPSSPLVAAGLAALKES